jgi:DNA-binding transcriptional ArsR family regulator
VSERDENGAESGCEPGEHGALLTGRHSSRALDRAVRLFRALGDAARLRTLEMLVGREACVTELAAASDESVSTVSHRLRLLRSEGLVQRRRDGRHIYYSLADVHVLELVRNALDHADELQPHT